MPEPLTTLSSPVVVLDRERIDTDQIIPARFLTTTGRDGLGAHAFADWRARGDCPVDDPRAAGCAVLVAGADFGCGSSREHAVWALLDLGLRVVIAPRFGDIFRANAQKNGLLPIEVDPAIHAELASRPWGRVSVDLPGRTLRSESGVTCRFTLDPFAAHCLERGLDPLGHLLEQEFAIAAFERRRQEATQ